MFFTFHYCYYHCCYFWHDLGETLTSSAHSQILSALYPEPFPTRRFQMETQRRPSSVPHRIAIAGGFTPLMICLVNLLFFGIFAIDELLFSSNFGRKILWSPMIFFKPSFIVMYSHPNSYSNYQVIQVEYIWVLQTHTSKFDKNNSTVDEEQNLAHFDLYDLTNEKKSTV